MKHLEKYYILKFAHNPNDPFGGRGYMPQAQNGILPGKPVAPAPVPGISNLPGKPVPAPQPTQSNTTQPTAMPRQDRSMFGTGMSRNPLQGLVFDKNDGSLPIDPNMFKMFQTGMQR